MHLLQSWKQSFQLLHPKNFGQFCLLVLNNMRLTVRVLTGRCWFLGIFLFIIPAFKLFGIAVAIFFLVLLSRPSVEIKDRGYIWKYTKKYFLRCALILFVARFLGGLTLIVAAPIIIALFGFIFGLDPLNLPDTPELKELFMAYAPPYMYPLVALIGFFLSFAWSIEVIVLLFLLDNGSEPHKQKSLYMASIERALRMVWRNLPIFALCSLVAAGVYMLETGLWLTVHQHAAQPGMTSMSFVVGLVWLLQSWIAAATLSVLYTKFLYENPQLYSAIK